MNFLNRVHDLPTLGIGVSTEYGAAGAPDSLDIQALRESHPSFGQFLEVGGELTKGFDEDTLHWADKGWPTTYHFLDINLHEPEDFDEAWLSQMKEAISRIQPAWLCGDAGAWHFGPRDRSHMLLLPPILTSESATAMAEGIVRLREHMGLEVLPENPPGALFLGNMHLLAFFEEVAHRGDTGILLDCAHLAIYQKLKGHSALHGLTESLLERVVEVHIAGARIQNIDGFEFVEDDHTPEVLPETWDILEHVVARAPNLKALVFECERNTLPTCIPGFERIRAIAKTSPNPRLVELLP